MLRPLKDPLCITNSVNWIVLRQDTVLVCEQTEQLPHTNWASLPALHAYENEITQLFELDGNATNFYVIDVGIENLAVPGYEFVTLRQALMASVHEPFGIVGRAWQYSYFYQTHKYCGRCGSPMSKVEWEAAMHCHSCGHRSYPRVSPCVIVAIYRDDEILLALHKRHEKRGLYANIAGFVESGESLEQAVVREIKEEVGIEVQNVTYFDSQPWPFPHALMMGFIAEWKSGEIEIDETELVEARWFTLNALPHTPPMFTIAGRLIEAVKKKANL